MSQLPIWVQYVQALAIPFLAFVLALAGAWVGWQQLQLNRIKLHYDLYDRRFKVYEAASDVLLSTMLTDTPSDEERTAFFNGIENAPFLLDDEVHDYLRTVAMHLHKVERHFRDLKMAGDDGEAQKKCMHVLTEDALWAGVELKVLQSKFARYLVLPRVKIFPWS